MVFSSLVFLSVFLPMVFLSCLAVKNVRIQNGILLAASLLFYAYGEPVYVLLMTGSSFVNYLAARLMGAKKSRKKQI